MTGSIILLVVLIALNAVFASAEIAVISMNDKRLKWLAEEGDKRAVKLTSLTEQPARFLATIQVAITLAGLLSSAFAADNFAGPIVEKLFAMGVRLPAGTLKNIVVVLITLLLAYFNLVFGELVPKRIAMKRSESLALSMAGMLAAISRLFAPLVALLTVSTNGVLWLLGFREGSEEEKLTEEEILMILEEGNEQGLLDAQETEIIQNVFELGDISCEQLCTHRMDVIALEEEEPAEQWEAVIHAHRHTYYPVYRESKDHITGLLDARDYYRLQEKTREEVFKYAVRPAYFVPEEIKAATLLRNMRQKKKYFAILIDEYGGMTGIVTAHDLIEALVGTLPEEEAVEEKDILPIRENLWKIRGDAEIGEINELLGVALPDTSWETFNGFLYQLLGRVPEDGETLQCTYNNLEIQIDCVKKHRIEEATVQLVQ